MASQTINLIRGDFELNADILGVFGRRDHS
jgi:hypothetical protein